MPSRADTFSGSGVRAPAVSSAHAALRVVGGVLHAVAIACLALLLWRFVSPERSRSVPVTVSANGQLDASLASVVHAPSESVRVHVATVPNARSRAILRALRASGRPVTLTADRPLSPLSVSAEREWPALGGVRAQALGADSTAAVFADAAGTIDSLTLATVGADIRPGPVEGAVRVTTRGGVASTLPLVAGAPASARVLVVGAATWESKFLIAALEENGWPVDAAVSLSPRVTIPQGASRTPSRERHSIVVVLPGAPASTIAALPDFVRRGGGLVIVGAAARMNGLGSLRAGAPGPTIDGEVGAEASASGRRGLELTPIAGLAGDAVVLERQRGAIAVAARRVGAGRMVQVGYGNSWLWRMAGNDDAPASHRRWWTAILAGVVPQTAPVNAARPGAEHDTLDAAPVSALARDIGLPSIRAAAVTSTSGSLRAALNFYWLLALATLSFVTSWTLRRWRGIA